MNKPAFGVLLRLRTPTAHRPTPGCHSERRRRTAPSGRPRREESVLRRAHGAGKGRRCTLEQQNGSFTLAFALRRQTLVRVQDDTRGAGTGRTSDTGFHLIHAHLWVPFAPSLCQSSSPGFAHRSQRRSKPLPRLITPCSRGLLPPSSPTGRGGMRPYGYAFGCLP